MKRDLDGAILHEDLVRYCGGLFTEQARGPDRGADPTFKNPADLILNYGKPRYLEQPMSGTEFLESLQDAEGSFSFLLRLSPEEIRKRREARTKKSTSWYTGF